MIDIHSHLIYGIDDGPSTIEESVRMVYEAQETGVETIIATPHFEEYLSMFDEVHENFQELAYRTADCGVTIKLGCEVRLNPCILRKIKDKSKICLDDSKFMLFEFSPGSLPVYSYDVIYRLQLEGIVPIIAHPERNMNFFKDNNLLLGFTERGCLLQVDAASIISIYGERIKNFSRSLIELDLVHFVASDAHRSCGYSDWYLKAYRNVVQWVGEEKAERLFVRNAKKIIDSSRGNVVCTLATKTKM